jgi:hypothetical protein
MRLKRNHRHERIHRLLISAACLPCFGWVVTTWLWQHNQVQKIYFDCTVSVTMKMWHYIILHVIMMSVVQCCTNTLTAHWRSLPALFWLRSYDTSRHLVVAPQSGAKDLFYCTVSVTMKMWHYIILHDECCS